MSSIKQLIQELAPEGEEIQPEDFSSLILDDSKLDRDLTLEDKKYLEEFSNVEILSMSNTGIKSLVNLPDLPELKRIELNSNNLDGANLKHLAKYPQLHTIKFSANALISFGDLDVLKSLPLRRLNLLDNPISEKEGYRDQIFAMFPELSDLDNLTKEEVEVASEEDEEEDDEFDGVPFDELDEETKARILAERAEMEEDGEEGEDDFDYGDDEDLELDAEDQYDEEYDSEEGLGKHGREGAEDDSEEEQVPKKKKK